MLGYLILVLILAPLVLGVMIETQQCEQCKALWAYRDLSMLEAEERKEALARIADKALNTPLHEVTWECCKSCGHVRPRDDTYQDQSGIDLHNDEP